MHADTKELQIQSRNNILGEKSDMYGVVKWILERENAILRFFESIAKGFPAQKQTILACEFAGSNIQKNVAVNQVQKFLVIYGVQVDQQWLAQDDWANLHLESLDERIYNVRDDRLTKYTFKVDMNDSASLQNQLVSLVDEVDKLCPFASAIFNVQGNVVYMYTIVSCN
jgi:hypothetical protein